MGFLSVRTLEEILNDAADIQKMIEDSQPYTRDDADIDELIEDLNSKAVSIIDNITTLGKIVDHLRKDREEAKARKNGDRETPAAKVDS